jgi:hypothetical protein
MTRPLLAVAATAAALAFALLVGVLFGAGLAYRLLADGDPFDVTIPHPREDAAP